MRANSGWNLKTALVCLLSMLNYIVMQVRKVNSEKAILLLGLSITFFVNLRVKLAFSTSYALWHNIQSAYLLKMSC